MQIRLFVKLGFKFAKFHTTRQRIVLSAISAKRDGQKILIEIRVRLTRKGS